MPGILNLYNILLLYGLSIFINIDGKVLQYTSSLKTTEPENLTNVTAEKSNTWNIKHSQHDVFYNPVLQNVSSLFEYLNSMPTDRATSNERHSRQKRSRSRNCSGQCEHSLCPWREEWDEEITRIPQFIRYAVCENPTCNFDFVGLGDVSIALEMRTHCDLVKIDIQVTEDNQEKWLTDWPIACVCTKRQIVTDFFTQFRHPGKSSDEADVDITNNVSLEPISRQRMFLGGARYRSLSRAQRRRLRHQRRNMRNSESWEQIMERKNNRT
ncbi:uncharacterized protein LOC123529840 [Mercenaria mercenaria]|uniref:uncharacterized protein LOC123529840 n=1 Tax=Mercenaria mercenaria TaxID=6596 RepID=UPI00234F8BF4|nr:uncharacterized protein LOC123529840 [Mercenaria mercenaria]